MLFVVRFTDHPDSLAVRETFMTAHLQWLAQHEVSVRAAGSLRVAPEKAPVGGLWIVEGESRKEVEALLTTDPFWVEGLRKDCEILHWSTAFEPFQEALTNWRRLYTVAK